MIKEDYLIRMIKDLIKTIAKFFFGSDSVTYQLPDEREYTETDYLYQQLVDMINQGDINEAEDLLYEKLDPQNKKYLELGLDFYSKLNNLTDEYLASHNYSRDEIELGLKTLVEKFGDSGLLTLFENY
ncbi:MULTISPECIES: DUF6483 family protein [Tissierellales]|jgi:hypothetical protein|uniref:Uncharacterized protein n=1 Tax=Acidilutibacter cellobiosedens TaxID=2507161 RepID=A0A410QCW3_9FIRM|nr:MULTISPECIES: DUF6483 family protein [Tissierellales]MBE6083196.1 hypothetical protein [Tissierellaceae bacterium]QAT61830.1 hypothetical protein EQM13_09610 [Acidilutibacter cellobiosedens]SCL81975.1 hypothetical protein PP176A_0174 [Sporanaerobacter sp. PP17-6a]